MVKYVYKRKNIGEIYFIMEEEKWPADNIKFIFDCNKFFKLILN